MSLAGKETGSRAQFYLPIHGGGVFKSSAPDLPRTWTLHFRKGSSTQVVSCPGPLVPLGGRGGVGTGKCS